MQELHVFARRRATRSRATRHCVRRRVQTWMEVRETRARRVLRAMRARTVCGGRGIEGSW